MDFEINTGQHPPIRAFALSKDTDDPIDYAIQLIAEGLDYDQYFDCFRDHYSSHKYDQGRWQMMIGMARAVWQRTPLPAHDYACGILPAMKRNDSCYCGSGKKYKRCCQPIDHGLRLTVTNFLPMLLEYLPRDRWPELTKSQLSMRILIGAANHLTENNAPEKTVALLKPWFTLDEHFCDARNSIFDLLVVAYLGHHDQEALTHLLDRAVTVGSRAIRVAALQHQALIVAKTEQFDIAWDCFQRAKETDPESLVVPHLEVILLLSEGRIDEAKGRSQFWAHKLRRRRKTVREKPELETCLQMFDQVRRHGRAGIDHAFAQRDPLLQGLSSLLAEAPPIKPDYQVETCGEAIRLKPGARLSNLLDDWHQMGPSDNAASHPPSKDIASGELHCRLEDLQNMPLLLNAFEPLSRLITLIHTLHDNRVDLALVHPLLERSEELLREVLRTNHAAGLPLDQNWPENRHVLDLLGKSCKLRSSTLSDEEAVPLLEWQIFTLDPDDHQGLRHRLVESYLGVDRLDDALSLSDEQRPHDGAAMHYSRALARYAAGRHEYALEALKTAVNTAPEYRQCLLGPLKLHPQAEIDNNDTPEQYRRITLDLWKKYNALDWLEAYQPKETTAGGQVRQMAQFQPDHTEITSNG